MARILESAMTAAILLGTFALLMIPGFWLRFGAFPWELMP